MKIKIHKILVFYCLTLKKRLTESNGRIYLRYSPAFVLEFALEGGSDSCTQVHARRSWPITFILHHGTRQGCPLSPLLFILALEPFAISIRNHPIIKGIQIVDVEHRIALFAADTLLFLTNLEQSFSALADVISRFGKFSGYKVNKTKSSVLFLNERERLCPTVQHPFMNAPEGFRYLGIFITPNLNSLVSANYDPVILKVKEFLCRWVSLPLSVIGHINAFKMNVLPKFLYLFQSIPLPPPPKFFQDMKTTLLNSFGRIGAQDLDSNFYTSHLTEEAWRWQTYCGTIGQPGLGLPVCGSYHIQRYLGLKWKHCLQGG